MPKLDRHAVRFGASRGGVQRTSQQVDGRVQRVIVAGTLRFLQQADSVASQCRQIVGRTEITFVEVCTNFIRDHVRAYLIERREPGESGR